MNSRFRLVSLFFFLFLLTGTVSADTYFCNSFGCVDTSTNVDEFPLLNPSFVARQSEGQQLNRDPRVSMFASEERRLACGAKYAHVCNSSHTEMLDAVLRENNTGRIVGETNVNGREVWLIKTTRPIVHAEKEKMRRILEELMGLEGSWNPPN